MRFFNEVTHPRRLFKPPKTIFSLQNKTDAAGQWHLTWEFKGQSWHWTEPLPGLTHRLLVPARPMKHWQSSVSTYFLAAHLADTRKPKS